MTVKENKGHSASIRERLGVLLLDAPKYLYHLYARGHWTRVGNRGDVLDRSPWGRGVRCKGRWSSDLHACRVSPALGRRLMRTALRQWPVEFRRMAPPYDRAQISFILPFRGVDRLPHLELTIHSILGQRDVAVECIVVEQSPKSVVRGLPRGVRHIHLAHPTDSAGWRKSWAYNVGVAEASADVVVCHDADILAPADYGREVLVHLETNGRDVAHLQRFLFCLDWESTSRVLDAVDFRYVDRPPERVRQNWQGGTLAIRKDAFVRIGGFDEQFVGWGGEDNEFYDRCTVLEGSRHGYLPFFHLWHAPQDAKSPAGRDKNLRMLHDLLTQPRERRIEHLHRRQPDLAARRPFDENPDPPNGPRSFPTRQT